MDWVIYVQKPVVEAPAGQRAERLPDREPDRRAEGRPGRGHQRRPGDLSDRPGDRGDHRRDHHVRRPDGGRDPGRRPSADDRRPGRTGPLRRADTLAAGRGARTGVLDADRSGARDRGRPDRAGPAQRAGNHDRGPDRRGAGRPARGQRAGRRLDPRRHRADRPGGRLLGRPGRGAGDAAGGGGARPATQRRAGRAGRLGCAGRSPRRGLGRRGRAEPAGPTGQSRPVRRGAEHDHPNPARGKNPQQDVGTGSSDADGDVHQREPIGVRAGPGRLEHPAGAARVLRQPGSTRTCRSGCCGPARWTR